MSNKVKCHAACLILKTFNFPCYSYTCLNIYFEILKKWRGGCGKLALQWDQKQTQQKAKVDVKLDKILDYVYMTCFLFQLTTPL